MGREFDVIVFGASGFTGQFVVEEVARSMDNDALYRKNNLKWAIAGRNKDKLNQVLIEAAKNTSLEWCKQLPIIEADVKDYESLVNLCKKTRLIITVVGPYRLYGEPLVKAAVEAATNYVDISGEPKFLEEMQLKYFHEAKKQGVYIVNAAGWDSIPADVGVTWTKQQFKGDLDSVEIFVSSNASNINIGTWHSAIGGYSDINSLKPLRKQLYQDILPPPKTRSPYPLKSRSIMGYVKEAKGYCLPFPGSDKSVVRRSEVFKYNTMKERPVQCETYFRTSSFLKGISIIFVAIIFGVMAKFSVGRYLLLKYPEFFSFGFVAKNGFPRENLKNKFFSHVIVGYGWDDKLDDVDRHHDAPPKKKIITRVSGSDPGYTSTAQLLVHAGMTLLFDQEKLPPPGVITPGACFRDTYLIDRLSKRDIKFEVLELC